MPAALAADLAAMLDRDLRTLRRELEAYPDERQIWQPVPGLPNTAGTLALHLAGNLQHYVGARWGGTGYVRNRDAEFARRDVPRAELIAEIERARAAVAAGLGAVGRGGARRGVSRSSSAGCRIRTGDFLVHTAVHLAYHLGQVDAHRRVVTGNGEGVGAVKPARAREREEGLSAIGVARLRLSRSSSPRSRAARSRCRAPDGPGADPARPPSAGPTSPSRTMRCPGRRASGRRS